MKKLNILKKFILLNNIIQRNHVRLQTRCLSWRNSEHRSEKADVEDDDERPVKFTTSKAASVDFENSAFNQVNRPSGPWYERVSLVLSLFGLLIYIFIRKENALDERLQHLDNIFEAVDKAYREKNK